MTPPYPDSLTLAEARSLFFARSGLGGDGGYSARWVRVETKPFPVYFPNTACRVEGAKLGHAWERPPDGVWTERGDCLKAAQRLAA